MSRAFIKEDVETFVRSPRRKSATGLPPGALNYLTADGAQELRARLTRLESAADRDEATISHLEHVLASATIVDPQTSWDEVLFGTAVTLQTATGELERYRIVGVDEVHLQPGNVSWVSAVGKTLLGAQRGQRVKFADEEVGIRTVVSIDDR